MASTARSGSPTPAAQVESGSGRRKAVEDETQHRPYPGFARRQPAAPARARRADRRRQGHLRRQPRRVPPAPAQSGAVDRRPPDRLRRRHPQRRRVRQGRLLRRLHAGPRHRLFERSLRSLEAPEARFHGRARPQRLPGHVRLRPLVRRLRRPDPSRVHDSGRSARPQHARDPRLLRPHHLHGPRRGQARHHQPQGCDRR